MDFEKQNVIVTGGTKGIGSAIAEAFLQEGAHVTMTYAHDDTSAKQFRENHAQFSDQLSFSKFNVGKTDEVEHFFNEYDQTHETIDVLVNNAGVRKDQIVGMLSEEDWDAVLNTNLKGCFLMSKFAVQRMSRKRFGRIINITSPSGRLGFPGQSNYAASKAGMVAFTRSMAKEVASRKVTVNCVSPGFVQTDLIEDLKDDDLERYKNLVPLKRFGLPEEIAHAVLFLASGKADYITGATLDVTGGL